MKRDFSFWIGRDGNVKWSKFYNSYKPTGPWWADERNSRGRIFTAIEFVLVMWLELSVISTHRVFINFSVISHQSLLTNKKKIIRRSTAYDRWNISKRFQSLFFTNKILMKYINFVYKITNTNLQRMNINIISFKIIILFE